MSVPLLVPVRDRLHRLTPAATESPASRSCVRENVGAHPKTVASRRLEQSGREIKSRNGFHSKMQKRRDFSTA